MHRHKSISFHIHIYQSARPASMTCILCRAHHRRHQSRTKRVFRMVHVLLCGRFVLIFRCSRTKSHVWLAFDGLNQDIVNSIQILCLELDKKAGYRHMQNTKMSWFSAKRRSADGNYPGGDWRKRFTNAYGSRRHIDNVYLRSRQRRE